MAITDTQVLTKETCDYHGPYVPALYRVPGRAREDGTRGELTFCGHCVRYGVASDLMPWAEFIAPEFDTDEAGDQDEHTGTDGDAEMVDA